MVDSTSLLIKMLTHNLLDLKKIYQEILDTKQSLNYD